MTRRVFIFFDETEKKLLLSPEFNGSKEEYERRGKCQDYCDFLVEDLYSLFRVYDADAFRDACRKAQEGYHSFLDRLGKERDCFPVEEIKLAELPTLNADEICFILDGDIISTNSDWDRTIDGLYKEIGKTEVALTKELAGGESDWAVNLRCDIECNERIVYALEALSGE